MNVKVYVAMVQPDRDIGSAVGVFSTLELAQAAFADPGEWDERNYQSGRREWWQRRGPSYGYNDNEIYELTLDEVTLA